MKRFSVSQQVLDTILQYVAQRPFAEVAKLIETLQKDAKEIEDESEEKSE